MEKKYCFKCDAEQDVILKKVEKTFNVRGQNVNAFITIAECQKCHEEVEDNELADANDIIIFSEYRRKNDLLFPQQIKEIRNQYGLSQSDFSLLLGFGEKTIARYESGSVQDRTHDIMMKLSSVPSNFMVMVLNRHDDLGLKLIDKINSFSYFYNHFNQSINNNLSKVLYQINEFGQSYERLQFEKEPLKDISTVYVYHNESESDGFVIRPCGNHENLLANTCGQFHQKGA